MHKNKITYVLTLVLFCATTCFGMSKHKIKRRYLKRKVVDFQETQMIQREIATWKGAPEVDRLLIATVSKLPNVTVYEMKYKAKNGETCEGEWVKTRVAVGKSQSSHRYECYKEQMEIKKLHAVLDYDEPLFGPKEGAVSKDVQLFKDRWWEEGYVQLVPKEIHELN